MVDAAQAGQIWRIEYTDARAEQMASGIALDLREPGGPPSSPTYKPPPAPTLGAPEVIITILVTSAAKALIVTGLHVLENYLETKTNLEESGRVHVVLTGPEGTKEHFPFSLRQAGHDAVKEFVSEIISAVDKL